MTKDHVLIRIKACGVCRSNLHMIEGDWVHLGVPAKSPIIPGHEIVGTIEDVGSAVEHLEKGVRVGVQPLYSACLRCERCLAGREDICPSKEITGETVDGGYAELIAAPSEFVYKVPDSLSDLESAPLFCPGVTAYRAVRRSGATLGKQVAVVGIGGVGHLAIQFAKLAGAHVTAITSSSPHADLAREVGADETIHQD